MKKVFIVFAALFCVVLLASGCKNKYKTGVDIPETYPAELQLYGDGVIFESEEKDDEITLVYGVEDDLDDIIEYYNDLMQSLQLICNEENESRNEYHAEGIGCCYEFEIEARESEDKEKRYYDTVVEVAVEFNEERIELMENLQGTWMYFGQAGELFSELNRNGMYYKIDDNSYAYFENYESALAETYVFFLEDNGIKTKSVAGITEAYEIAFENIDNTEVMSMSMDGYPRQHFRRLKSSDIDAYKKINDTWNAMKGFWQRAGDDGEPEDEHRCVAYNFSDYTFEVYTGTQIADANILYDFIDDDTIQYELNGMMKTADVIFETVGDAELMSLQYEDTTIRFEKTTMDKYMEETIQMQSAETLENIQGLWYLVGRDGKITDAQKKLGFAYEFTGNAFDTYNNFAITNFNTEFVFTDEDTFEYVTSTGTIVNVDLVFEQIEGLDVMTYIIYSVEYHFVKVTDEEFLSYQSGNIDLTRDQLQGFWQMIGSNGEINDESLAVGFAYKFTDKDFKSYSNYQLASKNVEYDFIDDSTISFTGANDVSYTAGIKFESIQGIDVMTYTYNAADYHFKKTSYEEFMKNADISKAIIGFWVMVGSEGKLSDEIKGQGNAIEFTTDLMTTYTDYEVSIQTSDFVINENTILYDYGVGNLTAEIEFKTIDGEEVLCAVILKEEYYFVMSTYEEFIANK